MEDKGLKKYSPLGLLALAIIAGVAGVTAKIASDDAKDAGFEVIGYFSCGTEKYRGYQLVLTAEGDAFQVLYYPFTDNEVIARGKPNDLSYFIPRALSNAEISYYRYKWKEGDETYSLNRSTGELQRTIPGMDLSEFSEGERNHIAGYIAIGIDTPTTFDYDCKFGEEGKKLVWKAALEAYEHIKPKF